jgi:hypothetical protein
LKTSSGGAMAWRRIWERFVLFVFLAGIRCLFFFLFEQAIRQLGGIPLNKMMQEALDMGDEAHNRNNALASIVNVIFVQIALFLKINKLAFV